MLGQTRKTKLSSEKSIIKKRKYDTVIQLKYATHDNRLAPVVDIFKICKVCNLFIMKYLFI